MRPVISPYEALAAKVRALYGRRLRYEDFLQLGNCNSEQEVLTTLQRYPGWATAVEGLEQSPDQFIGRVELENALGDQLAREYRSLCYFLPQKDRKIMSFPVLLAEKDAILQTLRRLKATSYYEGIPHSQHLEGSPLDQNTLDACQDYDGLLAATQDTIYSSVLYQMRPESRSELPDYMTVESLMYTTYFSHMYQLAYQHYQGSTKATLLEAFGKQTDLLNLIYILRIKTYFPQTEELSHLLFPFNYRLSESFLQDLCAAPDANTAFTMIRSSHYGECFQSVDVSEVEDYYRKAFWEFNHRQLLTAPPSVYTAMSYLILKDFEMHALVNVIESVKYNVPFDSTFARLIST